MDIWVGDAGGSSGTDVVRRAPTRFDPLAWSGDLLLDGTLSGGRAAIMGIVPGRDGTEEVVLDAFTPAVTSDGSTIVFVSSSSEDPFSLWKADASGRRIARLAPSATAGQVVVTPDDRSVIYTSVVGDTASIRTVPLDGGNAHEARRRRRRVGLAKRPVDGVYRHRATLMACNLPGCAAPRPIGPAPFGAPVADAGRRDVAYATDRNIWVQSLAAGPPQSSRGSPTTVRLGPLPGRGTATPGDLRGRRSPTTSCCSKDSAGTLPGWGGAGIATVVIAVLRTGPGGPAPAGWPPPNDVRFTTPNGTFDTWQTCEVLVEASSARASTIATWSRLI